MKDLPRDYAPHNVEAEEGVLGSILLVPRTLLEVSHFLKAEDFYIVRHQWVYEALLGLHLRNEPIDITTVTNELEQAGRIEEVGGAAFILGLMNNTPTALHAEGYARIVERYALRRRMLAAAGRIAQAASDGTLEADGLIARAHEAVDEASMAYSSYEHRPADNRQIALEIQDDAWAYVSEPSEARGITFGFVPIDRMTRGFPGPVYGIVAGATGSAKSTVLRAIALSAALKGTPIFFFPLEQTAKETLIILTCALARVAFEDIWTGTIPEDALARYSSALDQLTRLPIRIYDRPVTSQQLIDIVKRDRHTTAWQQTGEGLVIVDTLDVLRDTHGRGERYDRVTEASARLQGAPAELGMMILAAKQLSRKVDEREDKRPRKSDLRDSGQVEEHARWIAAVYRPAYYWPRVKDAPQREVDHFAIDQYLSPGDQQRAWEMACEVIQLKRSFGGPGDGRRAARMAFVPEVPAVYPVAAPADSLIVGE